MSDTAIPIPSTDPHALAAPPSRAAIAKRMAWRFAPWALPVA